METRKSKVAKVIHNVGQFQSQGGTIFKHEVRFDNGDTGIYNSKSDTCTKFKEGQEAEYTIEPNGNYPAKIKPYTPPTGQGQAQSFGSKNFQPRNDKAIIAQTCLKAACELNAEKGGSVGIGRASEVLKDADMFFDWCVKKGDII